MKHDGVDRFYDLQVPEGAGDDPLPLVLDLHGYSLTRIHQRQTSSFGSLAEEEGFYVAFPSGINSSWNSTFGVGGKDDVGFLRALVTQVASQHKIDSRRIYVSGFSQGGMMAYRMACEASDLITAIAPIAGGVQEGSEKECNPERAVPVQSFRGRTDRIVPYEGGRVAAVNPVTSVLSDADTFKFSLLLNNCKGPVERVTLGDTSFCDTDTNCAEGVTVTNCTVESAAPPSFHNLYGNEDGLSLTRQSWDFLKQFSLPNADEAFVINAGHSGAWYNPDTAGQGQLIDIEPESQFLFLSWFTFTDAASANPNEQHWFTAQGNYSGNTADLTVYETLGGRFDDPQAVTTERVGTATLSFSDCGNGQLDYVIDSWDVQGSFPLLRAIPGTENVCEDRSGSDTEPLAPNDGRDGAWFDANTPGQGFLIDAHPNVEGDDFIFAAWFTYGDGAASGQRWLTAQGPLQGSTADIVVYETKGGSFDDPQPSETNAVGTMTIDFTDCSNASLTYSITDEALSGIIDIKRAIPGTEALCQELTGEE